MVTGPTRCAWCSRPWWPDRCTEEGNQLCADMITGMCGDGDHRRCRPETCEFAAEIHPGAIDLGLRALAYSGHRWAVVSVLESDDPVIVGTGDHLGRVKSLMRSGHIKAHGFAPDSVTKGLVMIVGSDGFLY